MAKTLNIEVIKQHKLKHTALLLAICALLLACLIGALPNTRAQYTTSDQDSHVFVFSKDQDVRVGLTEQGWTTKSGLDLKPGDVRIKQPAIQNLADNCYMRVNMRITDKFGNTLTPKSNQDKKRLDLILSTIYFDASDTVDVNSRLTTGDIEAKTNSGDLNLNCNSADFSGPDWNPEMQAYNFNYTKLFTKGSSATLFNRVIIPTDFTNADMALMDEYYINIWVQAIQPEGFTSVEDALSHLSNDNVPNNIEGINTTNSHTTA